MVDRFNHSLGKRRTGRQLSELRATVHVAFPVFSSPSPRLQLRVQVTIFIPLPDGSIVKEHLSCLKSNVKPSPDLKLQPSAPLNARLGLPPKPNARPRKIYPGRLESLHSSSGPIQIAKGVFFRHGISIRLRKVAEHTHLRDSTSWLSKREPSVMRYAQSTIVSTTLTT